MSDLSLIGAGLLVVGALAIVVEGALAAVWSLRISRAARLLSERIETERGLLEADVRRLRLAMEETVRLWQPYRKVLGWLRHPLVAALLQSYLRRRAAFR